MGFEIILACDSKRGIGLNGSIPWPTIPEDMKRFKKITTFNSSDKVNTVIMGRKTWDSLPNNAKPLTKRINCIISRDLKKTSTAIKNELREIHGKDIIIYERWSDYRHPMHDNHIKSISIQDNKEKLLGNITIAESLKSAINYFTKKWHKDIFIIGGGEIYLQTYYDKDCNTIHLTQFNEDYKCDTFAPEIPPWMILSNEENCKIRNVKFLTYTNISNIDSNEKQYISLIQDIFTKKPRRGRNGLVRSIFGPQHIFELDKFPLLTTKKMAWKTIVKELLFFIRGYTNAKNLDAQGVKIWNANTTSEFHKTRGLNYKPGDMGPMYGFNWRHFGAEYKDCNFDYTNQGHDQLRCLLESLNNDPNSRRHLMTTYDPSTVDECVLVPCHGLISQFYVVDGKLSCKMYQRSVDVGLGYPFNIASYALFVYLLCEVTPYIPGTLIMTLGDTHIYEEHIKDLRTQIKRIPLQQPTVEITKHCSGLSIAEKLTYLENLDPDDIKLKNYYNWPAIKLTMTP